MWKVGPNPLLSPPLTFPEVNQVPIRCWMDSESFPVLWPERDSNLRPSAPQPNALTTRPRLLSNSVSNHAKHCVPVPEILCCNPETRNISCATLLSRETWCLSLRYSTDTKRHGTCPCGALLSHKDKVPVRVVLYFYTEVRWLFLL